jgi:hypothetical protein
MPAAVHLAEALRVIAAHRGHVEMDLAYPNAERALWDVLSLAAGDIHIGYDDKQEIIGLITGKKHVTLREALNAVRGRR